MKEMQTHLEEMQMDEADIVVLKGGAEGLARITESTSGPAFEIEKATASGAPSVASAKSRTAEFWDLIPDADREQGAAATDAASNNEEAGTDRETEAVHEQMLVANQEHPTQLYRRLPWLSVMILVAIAGAFAIANNGLEQSWSSEPVIASKAVPFAEPREKLKLAAAEALKDLQPVEREERNLPSAQAAPLTAPLDHFEKPGAARAERVNKLANARAEIVDPPTRRGAARQPRHRNSVIMCLWCGNPYQRFGLLDLFAWHPKYRRHSGVRHPT
jgi:hypothetical protein